jgi:hypothetical protein
MEATNNQAHYSSTAMSPAVGSSSKTCYGIGGENAPASYSSNLVLYPQMQTNNQGPLGTCGSLLCITVTKYLRLAIGKEGYFGSVSEVSAYGY